MELEPAQKKVKMEKADTFSGGKASTTKRKKAWHESKNLLKRIAILLDNPSLIPSDISFAVGISGYKNYIHGHKIFFALASPVFHSMFYGNLKTEGGFVDVPDITPEAFRCLIRYVYTNSTASIAVANVTDVLVAARKYQMAKLMRYCYEFIQKSLAAETAAFFWKKARFAKDGIVEKQSIAEIKRNTGIVVSTKGFLELPEDMILELTSWNELTIAEVDLYQAVNKWAAHHSSGRCILRYIRFALFSAELLAAEQEFRKILSAEDFQDLCIHKLVGKELTRFNASYRTPVVPSFRLSVSVLVSKEQVGHTQSCTSRQLLGVIKLLVWPDVAPKACQILRQYVEKDYKFHLSFMVDPQHNYTRTYRRRVRKGSSATDAIMYPTTEAMRETEKSSALWSSPNFVCLKYSDESPHVLVLTVLKANLTYLGGKPPESGFGEASEFGVVIGKVLDGPIDEVRRNAAFEYQACEAEYANLPTTFECVLLGD